MYVDIIRQIDRRVNAVGVECFMRLQFQVLDHLSSDQFRHEITLAKMSEISEPGALRECAESYERGEEFDRFERQYLSDLEDEEPEEKAADDESSWNLRELSWRQVNSKCEHGIDGPGRRCNRGGTGWLVDVERMPVVWAFLCGAHGVRAVERKKALKSQGAFVSGNVVDEFITLDVVWRFSEVGQEDSVERTG